jgi:hypothetical protein
MRPMTHKPMIAVGLSVILGLSLPAAAQTESPEGYGDGYTSGAYGRVRAADGGATIVRADSERGEPDAASVNAPLFPGDALRTNGSQRVEVQLAGGTLVRVDRTSDLTFQSLPNPSAKYHDNTVLALNAGTVSVASRLGEKEEFRIDTRGASIYLLGEGEFRIESDDRGVTQVASRRGVAEVVGNDASVLVRGGMRTAAVAGSTPETPRAYSAYSSDGFDRWCDARDDSYRVQDRYASNDDPHPTVPDEVRPYQTELSQYGNWTVDPDYGSVWYPYGVASSWRPYSSGYWSYGPGGYFWVSTEPWGWAPYHYGNWQWTVHGWCWVPGHVFAGAWVSWSWGSAYVGWAPLDYWGRPGCGGGAYYAGYYDPGSWTFVGYQNIGARNVQRYAVPIGTVRDDLGRATVVARGPRVDPRRVAQSPVWRERALRQVSEDRAAHMLPSQAGRTPARKLMDVQDQLLRRPSLPAPALRSTKDAAVAPSVERRTPTTRSRRIFDDPRTGAGPSIQPETRDDVRDLYQRMSRPRETRGQDVLERGGPPSYGPQPSRADRLRAEPPRADAPRAQVHAPSAPPPRAQPPRAPAPRPQAAPREKPKHGDKH